MVKMNKKTEVSGLNALVWKEGRLFVAKALEVEVASQGTSRVSALKNLREALDLYFEDKGRTAKKIEPLSNVELHQISGKYNYV